jgi:hypothetical protein
MKHTHTHRKGTVSVCNVLCADASEEYQNRPIIMMKILPPLSVTKGPCFVFDSKSF